MTRATRLTGIALVGILAAAGVVLAAMHAPGPAPSGDDKAAQNSRAVVEAWRTVRQMDCARCHGRDHDGSAAPSVLEFVRTQTRERFDRIVLDGAPERGMPGYGQTPPVADRIEAIYIYFLFRANGLIGRGEPFAPKEAREPDEAWPRVRPVRAETHGR